jgi:2-(1,2-epoxy-1,2-dihydrophenyl)acetyl-CoA isomerase
MAGNDTLVRYEERGGIGEIRFNRPERLNAIDSRTLQDFGRAIAWATQTDSVRCVIITGEGRAFSAGADVKDWSERLEGEAEPDGAASSDHTFAYLNDQIITSLYRLPKPVIAAINGPAVGMGLDIALAADLRVAATDAKMAVRYIRIGVVPDFGGTFLLPRLVGMTKATELAMTGRFFDAAEADAMGMLNEVVEPDELDAAARRWARLLADGPPVALGLLKRNLQDSLSTSFDASLRNETLAHDICASTNDMREGVLAMAQKREPNFVGN